MEIKKEILDYITSLNISYNDSDKKIYFNDEEASEYEIKVICERLKFNYNIDINVDKLKTILQDNGNITVIENDELGDITKIIDEDSSLKDSDAKSFLLWKKNTALWKTDKDGIKTSLIECQTNIEGFIENFPKYKNKIYFNVIRGYAEFNGKQITDKEIYEIMNDLNKYMLPYYSSPRGVKNAIDSVAFRRQRNINKTWLENNYKNNYDKDKDYIDILLRDIFRCEDLDKYYDLYYAEIKLHLLASLKKMCYAKNEMDYKYDNILVLCSEQGGTGKTSFCEYLYTFDNICYTNVWEPESVNFANKDFLEQLHDSAANVFDEVSVKRAIFNAVKSFISKKNDKFRKSYGYVADNKMRKFVLWGTSNNNDFLKDYTAGLERRWMIIHVSEDKMNGVYLKEKMQANNYEFVKRLWAQIMNMYNENKNFDMFLTHDWDDKLLKLQRDYKASNNETYNTIINDLLERHYGFYDEYNIDVDSIVEQYKYGNSADWCNAHNEELNIKIAKSLKNDYILKPGDRKIKYWGKIDRIQKTILYQILDILNFEYTKPSLAAELKITGKWKGMNNNERCYTGEKVICGYFRINKEERVKYTFDDKGQSHVPF